ncbi:S1C family serine protease [Methylogaea oryzae]|uniref:S1C family serine protease n=1 Tax=Methylogaea oryzae TaxID=1295382 RepID=UPI00402B9454
MPAGGGGEPASARIVTPRGDLAADEKSTIELFEKSKDSVVYITTKQQVMDVWTRNVFTVPRGTGSGFIWDDAGHVVTNMHVIEGSNEAQVRLSDGRDYKAALVGVSPAHDIAVLKIGVGFKRPPAVPIGSSRDLKVGQKAFAIGNPFGLDWSLTTGIVSALDRSLTEENGVTIEHLIQTDAPINPGNSGGPLLDSAGRLIGINTAIYSPSGANAGIGFAVPVDTVNRVVPQIIRQGRYVRPALGIEVDEGLNQRLTAQMQLEGVVVLRVTPGSAAAAAGLQGAVMSREGIKTGDVIVALEGRPVDSVGKLLARLDDYKVGDTVRMSVLRDGDKRDVSVTLQPGS